MRLSGGLFGVAQFFRGPAAFGLGMIYGCESRVFEGGAHPPGGARADGGHFSIVAEGVELGAGFHADAHELGFVHHPETVII
ncbi:MAG TPA: hypothetical protein VH597_07535 [Verrucomicrobiae bacterium]|nr:hypothetical protein [Verrucomicrobiae bacterium]